jgi:hypothetical protein
MTPRDKFTDLSVRDGIQLGSRGETVAYWIANPTGRQMSRSMTSDLFRRIALPVPAMG